MSQAEAASPHCHLVLVEQPADVLEELQKDGDIAQVIRATDFFKRQEQYRQQRRQRMLAKQQRRRQLEQQLIAAEAAAAAAREAAGRDIETGASSEAQASAASSSSTSSSVAGTAAGAAAVSSPRKEQQQPPSPLASQGSQAPSLSSGTTDEDTCGVCFDNNTHVAIKYCGHRLCVDCYRKVWEISGMASSCPFCRARLEGYLYLDWPLDM